jgi:hypothetical protein
MYQRRVQGLTAFKYGVALAAALFALAPGLASAQSCVTDFKDATGGTVSDGDTLCQEAVGNKCVFPLSVCVNQPGTEGGTCTAQTLKKKKVHASGHCGPVGKVSVKPSGTDAVCGSQANVTVRTKKKGKKAGNCKIKAKGGTSLAKITLLCEPTGSGMCPATTTTTTTASSTSTTTTTMCAGGCACGTPTPTRLSFTTGIGSGNCGMVQLSNGNTQKNLACSGLFTGGGGNTVPLPYSVPDMGNSLTGITNCACTALTLTNLTSADTVSNRNCTSVGCLFGPPLPIPNAGSTPTSVCVINVVATNASGTLDCATGESHLNLPLTSELYLVGDLFPNAPGIQVCPVCNKTCNAGTNMNGPCNTDTDCPGGGAGSCTGATVCHGGGNNGMACTAADSATLGTTNSFPTSQDCPPDPGLFIGGLPIAFDLVTGSKTLTATNNTASGQNNVFCGYCKDGNNGTSTGCFAGDPNLACPAPRPAGPVACSSNATCPAEYPDCTQRNAGAFGPAGGGAHTITEMGSPAGDMRDGAAHASTLASIFCIQPTFNATVDAAGDLPGPGAVTLSGTAQLQ